MEAPGYAPCVTHESGSLASDEVRGMFDRIAPVYDAMNRVMTAGLDFSPAMLERASRKSDTITWVEGDMLSLPFEDGSFDAATVGFGVRNVADLEQGVAELGRVLRPGGRLAILEITRPRGLLRPFFSLWFDRIVPLLGKMLPGGSAYAYLPASVRRFPGAEDLAELLERRGFRQVRFRLLGGTIVALHTAVATGGHGD